MPETNPSNSVHLVSREPKIKIAISSDVLLRRDAQINNCVFKTTTLGGNDEHHETIYDIHCADY